MPTSSVPEIVMSRKSDILTVRERQLILNKLACEGGDAYISARLWRAPNESDRSWEGSSAKVGSPLARGATSSFGLVGRKNRTSYVNDAGRIAGKIEQYLFKDPVIRDGADELFIDNMGGKGVDALRFWMNVNQMFTTGQWVWIQASRESVAPTLLERTERDLVKWTAYPSVAVPDWAFDEDGRLLWVIVETEEIDKRDPFAAQQKRKVRTLWRLGESGGVEVSRYAVNNNGGATDKAEEIDETRIVPIDEIPFVLLGKPSPLPWWFDDVEQIQQQLLNLDSLHIDNLVRTVFPQMIISAGQFDRLDTTLREANNAENGEVILQMVKEIVRGIDAPIVEDPEEHGITRFITPSAADLSAIPTEIERKRKLLFETTGLSLFNKETRQTQTAESKQFDQLDTESTLKNRALIMQKAEEALVTISLKLDPAFKEYDPVWPTSFDVVDAAADMAVVSTVADMGDAVPAMRKMALKAAVRVLTQINGRDRDLAEQADKEIDAADFTEERIPAEDNPLGFGGGGFNRNAPPGGEE